MDKILLMLQLQNQLNDATNGENWTDGITKNNKKIIMTSNGIKFFLDSIHPSNTIIETFVREIHSINPIIDWNNKIINK